jgi:hypothetical protein
VPAAAVIPAPVAYIQVVAVKKLVVGQRNLPWHTVRRQDAPLRKSECSRQASAGIA